MRALVISDMAPSPGAPGRGVFVRDQVAALRRLPDLHVDLDEAPPGARALAALAARCARARGYDVVHAHYGLTAWPALAVRGARRAVTLHGTDLRHPRTRRITHAALVPSDTEGFGLAVLEALACDVPVLATPVGVHAQALDGVAGTLCEPFDATTWRSALQPHLDATDPRVDGREHAARFSAEHMA